MYSDEDLDLAVNKGVFTKESVENFRNLQALQKKSPLIDEENIRLIGGFNDIFVVVACLLLLLSSQVLFGNINKNFGYFVLIVFSWGLSEYFVKKRKMALPAIVLSFPFFAGILLLTSSLSPLSLKDLTFIVVLIAVIVASYIHWLRFNVPITIAIGTLSATLLFIVLIIAIFPFAIEWQSFIIFMFGIMIFLFAMYWDSSDTNRVTSKSDIAFWLHLLSAPFIVHPIFSHFEYLAKGENIWGVLIVVVLYSIISAISLAINRRVLMLSPLIYVLAAISNLIEIQGGVSYSFSIAGILIGGSLLLLSVYWHSARVFLVGKLPLRITKYIPKI